MSEKEKDDIRRWHFFAPPFAVEEKLKIKTLQEWKTTLATEFWILYLVNVMITVMFTVMIMAKYHVQQLAKQKHPFGRTISHTAARAAKI